ncbi:uncharacterized protein EV420DRAFT_1514948 [Desarmillaria tabescens]|uniref:Uncharacterized protein n=1 Tax=Armillaria tabescens TaxID=1929756 RepID=A0AA39TWT8_ARMTA|nr:uncharacterized protein EV420DRAFT_1514948 [Desarmillaria tabescens]KAK0465569.1 hypothetical protein EV420DRAFT_1514948 [Desarmillaria tabescens]
MDFKGRLYLACVFHFGLLRKAGAPSGSVVKPSAFCRDGSGFGKASHLSTSSLCDIINQFSTLQDAIFQCICVGRL